MFWHKNKWAIIMVLLLITTELCYLPILDSVVLLEKDNITLGDALYYINVHIGHVGIVPLIVFYKQTKSIESKSLYMSMMLWVAFELLQQCNILFNWDLQILNMYALNVSDRLQIIMSILVVFLTYLGHRKWSTSYL